MPYRDTKTLTARAQAQLRFVPRVAKPASVFQCVIISADAARREMFERAAADGGWQTSLCVDAPAALAHLSRSFLQLAIVDLEGQSLDVFRPVVEKITARRGSLLIVCGNEGRVDEEIWVRQSGAWLYLPGVTEGTNFALLCGEARQIAERLSAASGVDRPRSVAGLRSG
jgi:DNA-binding NtrC family response regulator